MYYCVLVDSRWFVIRTLRGWFSRMRRTFRTDRRRIRSESSTTSASTSPTTFRPSATCTRPIRSWRSSTPFSKNLSWKVDSLCVTGIFVRQIKHVRCQEEVHPVFMHSFVGLLYVVSFRKVVCVRLHYGWLWYICFDSESVLT